MRPPPEHIHWDKDVESESVRIPMRFVADTYIAVVFFTVLVVFVVTNPWNTANGLFDVLIWGLTGLLMGGFTAFLLAWGSWLVLSGIGWFRFTEAESSASQMLSGGFMFAFGQAILWAHLEDFVHKAFKPAIVDNQPVLFFALVCLFVVLIATLSLGLSVPMGRGRLLVDQDWLHIDSKSPRQFALRDIVRLEFIPRKGTALTSTLLLQGHSFREELTGFKGLNEDEATWIIDWLDEHLKARRELVPDVHGDNKSSIPDDLQRLRGSPEQS